MSRQTDSRRVSSARQGGQFWVAIDFGGSNVRAATARCNPDNGTFSANDGKSRWKVCDRWPGSNNYSLQVPTLVVAEASLPGDLPEMRWGCEANQQLSDHADRYEAYHHIKHFLMDTDPLPPAAQKEKDSAVAQGHDVDEICRYFVQSLLNHLLQDVRETDSVIVLIAVPVHVDDDSATRYFETFQEACQLDDVTIRVADEATAATIGYLMEALDEQNEDVPEHGGILTVVDFGSVTTDISTVRFLGNDELDFLRRESIVCGSGLLNQVLQELCESSFVKFSFNEKLEQHKENIPKWREALPTGPSHIPGDNTHIMEELERTNSNIDRERWQAIQRHCSTVMEQRPEAVSLTLFLTGGAAGSETLIALITTEAASLDGMHLKVRLGNSSTFRNQHTLSGLLRISDNFKLATGHRLSTDLFMCCHDPESPIENPVPMPLRLWTKGTDIRGPGRGGQQADPALPIVFDLEAVSNSEDDSQCLTMSLETFVPKPGATVEVVQSDGTALVQRSSAQNLISLGKHNVDLEIAVRKAVVYVYVQYCMRTAIFGLVYYSDGKSDRAIEALRHDDVLHDGLFGARVKDFYAKRGMMYTEAARVMLPREATENLPSSRQEIVGNCKSDGLASQRSRKRQKTRRT